MAWSVIDRCQSRVAIAAFTRTESIVRNLAALHLSFMQQLFYCSIMSVVRAAVPSLGPGFSPHDRHAPHPNPPATPAAIVDRHPRVQRGTGDPGAALAVERVPAGAFVRSRTAVRQ